MFIWLAVNLLASFMWHRRKPRSTIHRHVGHIRGIHLGLLLRLALSIITG